MANQDDLVSARHIYSISAFGRLEKYGNIETLHEDAVTKKRCISTSLQNIGSFAQICQKNAKQK